MKKYSKEYFQNQLLGIIKPIQKYYNGGKVQFSTHSAWYENVSADMEAFARPLWGLVPFWCGGGNNAELEALYIDGLTDGTDPESGGYWGECHDRDQRFVEMAAIAYGIIFAPDKIWEPLSPTAKKNLENWLLTINSNDVCDSNWIFFRVMVNTALEKVGGAYNAEITRRDMARLDEFYLSGGWYRDGARGQKDYYIAFAFHFYGLILAAVKPDSEYAEKYKKRACEFAKDFIYWFDADGEALPYGRSLTYRFAQTAFWSACVIADIRPFPIEVMKGIIVRNLEKWLEKDIFDNAAILSVGYDYPNLLMAEHYNAHGSPYWALKAYAFLMLPDDHEFWSCDAAPMPELESLKVIPQADMLISRRGGHSTAYIASDNEAFDCGQIIPKYLKFAYSARFGFNVMRSNLNISEAAPDSMLAFEADGLIFVRRRFIRREVEKESITIEWSPVKGISVVSVIEPTAYGHIRTHTVTSDFECTAYDAGFAVSSSDGDGCSSKTERGCARAENKFQYCSVSSQGGEGVIITASPNTNIRYRKTVIPAVKYQIPRGKTVLKTVIRDEAQR